VGHAIRISRLGVETMADPATKEDVIELQKQLKRIERKLEEIEQVVRLIKSRQ
jgi:hypothetical protein